MSSLLIGEIHVRALRLQAADDTLLFFESLLSPEERDRASRFCFEPLRRSFTFCRGGLRLLLGEYLHSDPARLTFIHGEYGKPALVDAPDLRFNVSHSGGLALFAFATGREVGVDVEKIRALKDADGIARRYFAPEEVSDQARLPESDRLLNFFHTWTRKEAYIKAVGQGLNLPLDGFQVPLDPKYSPQSIRIKGCAEQDWWVLPLEPADGYVGAVAFQGAIPTFRIRQTEDPEDLQ